MKWTIRNHLLALAFVGAGATLVVSPREPDRRSAARTTRSTTCSFFQRRGAQPHARRPLPERDARRRGAAYIAESPEEQLAVVQKTVAADSFRACVDATLKLDIDPGVRKAIGRFKPAIDSLRRTVLAHRRARDPGSRFGRTPRCPRSSRSSRLSRRDRPRSRSSSGQVDHRTVGNAQHDAHVQLKVPLLIMAIAGSALTLVLSFLIMRSVVGPLDQASNIMKERSRRARAISRSA